MIVLLLTIICLVDAFPHQRSIHLLVVFIAARKSVKQLHHTMNHCWLKNWVPWEQAIHIKEEKFIFISLMFYHIFVNGSAFHTALLQTGNSAHLNNNRISLFCKHCWIIHKWEGIFTIFTYYKLSIVGKIIW